MTMGNYCGIFQIIYESAHDLRNDFFKDMSLGLFDTWPLLMAPMCITPSWKTQLKLSEEMHFIQSENTPPLLTEIVTSFHV